MSNWNLVISTAACVKLIFYVYLMTGERKHSGSKQHSLPEVSTILLLLLYMHLLYCVLLTLCQILSEWST